jgi:hypothetical protein
MAKNNEILLSLLEQWTPPIDIDSEEGNITPVGFISTSFTFHSEFFDEECISRFLSLETEKENDGAAYLVEREEKLAGLQAGIVLIDQHNCRGDRSLRWDLVPCRVKNGIMHAKITVLQWSHCIRVIISSANLSKDGYCINQEIFGVFDYYNNAKTDLAIATDTIRYLSNLTDLHCGDIVKQRAATFLNELLLTLKKWNIESKTYKKDEIVILTLFVSPEEKDALPRLREIWDKQFSSPPVDAYVTSPFFDEYKTPTSPSEILPSILKQRGETSVTFQASMETVTLTDNRIVFNAPEYLKKSNRSSTTHYFQGIEETGENEKSKPKPRPLHLKSIWLENDSNHLFMLGSSNFTSPAWASGKRANYEANVTYMVSSDRNKKAYQALCNSYLDGKKFDIDSAIFKARVNEDEVSQESEIVLLPEFFGEVVFSKAPSGFMLDFSFCNDPALSPSDFQILYELGKQKLPILTESDWITQGKKHRFSIEWRQKFVPDHLLVTWKDNPLFAYWPVIVESQISLPPVESLKNLSLDALLYILSSSQPIHRLLEQIKRFQKQTPLEDQPAIVVDAHKLVDTSGFLLQRTRRVSYAIKSLIARLEKPVFTKESLNWRLFGPVGVQSLIDAIGKEAKTNDEKSFLLAEVALELSRMQPKETSFSIKSKEVKKEVQQVIIKLLSDSNHEAIHDEAIRSYSIKAMKKALNEF